MGSKTKSFLFERSGYVFEFIYKMQKHNKAREKGTLVGGRELEDVRVGQLERLRAQRDA